MSKFDEIRRLNNERAQAALYFMAKGALNTPTEAEDRFARDAWMKAEVAYQAAVDALSHSELLEFIRNTERSER